MFETSLAILGIPEYNVAKLLNPMVDGCFLAGLSGWLLIKGLYEVRVSHVMLRAAATPELNWNFYCNYDLKFLVLGVLSTTRYFARCSASINSLGSHKALVMQIQQ